MDEYRADVIEAMADVRAALRSRERFDELLVEAVHRACAVGVPRAALARSMGIHRATFYRQFGDVLDQGSPACAPTDGRPSC